VKISFVTTNKGKFAEIGEMLRSRGHEPVHLPIAYPEMQADSLEMVVIQGMEWLMKRYRTPILVDDSGLFIEALKGFPGVYSAHAYKTLRCDGILRLMKGVEDRSARFECVLGFMEPGGDLHLFKGVSKGLISEVERGTKGFGFDPIFIPEGYTQTFAELDMAVKNSISHRGRAFQKFFEFIEERSKG